MYDDHAKRITSLEGRVTSTEGRLDSHDATIAAQGRWLNGYEDELGEHDGAIKALQKIAVEFSAFMHGLRTAGLWLHRAWLWFFRPVLVAVASVSLGGLAWIFTHLPAILHGLDKVSRLLSQ